MVLSYYEKQHTEPLQYTPYFYCKYSFSAQNVYESTVY